MPATESSHQYEGLPKSCVPPHDVWGTDYLLDVPSQSYERVGFKPPAVTPDTAGLNLVTPDLSSGVSGERNFLTPPIMFISFEELAVASKAVVRRMGDSHPLVKSPHEDHDSVSLFDVLKSAADHEGHAEYVFQGEESKLILDALKAERHDPNSPDRKAALQIAEDILTHGKETRPKMLRRLPSLRTILPRLDLLHDRLVLH